jgi:hypothetical protein
MPIDIKVLHGGLRLLCRGVLTGDDLIGVHNRLLASPEVLKRSKYALVDEMAVDRLDVSTAELETVADLDKRLAAVAAAHAVIAIVAPRDLGFGLARMWEVFAEETGWETMTFRSVAEAEPWVCEKVKQNFGVDLAEEVKTASG